MKKVYYVEADCENGYNDEFVFWANTKVMATFTKRKEAFKWLIRRSRLLKEWCANEIKAIRKHNKQFGTDTTITFDLYKAIVDDDFDIEIDNIFETDNYHVIESRYLVGRY